MNEEDIEKFWDTVIQDANYVVKKAVEEKINNNNIEHPYAELLGRLKYLKID